MYRSCLPKRATVVLQAKIVALCLIKDCRTRGDTQGKDMAKLNVFVDGTWLFNACGADRALANRLEYPERRFQLDHGKLTQELLAHARQHVPECDALGDMYFATSIFNLPENFADWPSGREDVTSAEIESIQRSTSAREKFSNSAVQAGYSDAAIFRPELKGWMLGKLREHRFQEKQVDATVVALLVKYAITCPQDVHVIITGDSDVLPAIRVAYPEYSNNVLVATTHPEQLKADSRQTSYALADFNYLIPPFYIEQNAEKVLQGAHVHKCVHCNKVFSRQVAIPRNRPACCKPCHEKRE